MKVLLLTQVPGQGRPGDIIEVSRGYAQNFLFPKRLARILTIGMEKQLSDQNIKQKKEAQKLSHQQEELYHQLQGIQLKIHKKSSPQGRLYESVHIQDIVHILLQKGFVITEKMVKPLHGIKQQGKYPVIIRCGKNLDAKIQLMVE